MHRISAVARLRYGIAEFGPMPLIAVVVLLAQAALGLGVRYGGVGVVGHMAGAAVAIILVTWAGLQSVLRHWKLAPVRRAAMLMLSFTFSQLLLGIGAYWNRLNGGLDFFPMAHAAAGAASLATAAVMAFQIYRRIHPEDEALARGGIVIA